MNILDLIEADGGELLNPFNRALCKPQGESSYEKD